MNNRENKSIGIEHNTVGGGDMQGEVFTPELLKKIREALAEGIARSLVSAAISGTNAESGT